jgi:Na+/H+ antiporter NhaC
MSEMKQREEESPVKDPVAGTKLSVGRNRLLAVISAAGLIAAFVAGFITDGPTLWGFLPIGLYAVLCLLGMDLIVGKVIALASGFLILQPTPVAVADVLGDSLADNITMIGLIIILGAGVGEVLKHTGVATTIVHGVMRAVGERSSTAVIYGVMIACALLVGSLGTLAGALAICAPLLLPICARLGFTKSATASMMFIGGVAGLSMAPFAGSNVAIMTAAEVGYLDYVLFGGGPIAILSLVLGPFIVRWMQRYTAKGDDFYDAEELGAESASVPLGARRATLAFAVTLLASVGYAISSGAGTSFPLLALPVIGVVTGLAARLPIAETLAQIYKGMASMINFFIMFWLLAALFIVIDKLEPFQIILETYQESLSSGSPFVFSIAIALLGWVGVPGATAAQVVLLDKVFGDLGATLGVTAASWVVVLLFASKADTYGPFPNGNMIGVMGLARSQNLKNMMITGWMVLVPACIMYGLILFFQTR